MENIGRIIEISVFGRGGGGQKAGRARQRLRVGVVHLKMVRKKRNSQKGRKEGAMEFLEGKGRI